MGTHPTQASMGEATSQGTVPSVSGLAGTHFGTGLIRQVRFIFNDVAFTLTDNGSTGSGSLKIYDFPTGAIGILGLVGQLTYATALTTDAGCISSFGTAAVGAVGVLTANSVANIVPSTATAIATSAATFNVCSVTSAITQLTGGIGTANNALQDCTSSYSEAAVENNFEDVAQKINEALRQVENAGMKVLNGTGTAADLYLNIATPNDPSTSNAITIDGQLTLTYIFLGSLTSA